MTEEKEELEFLRWYYQENLKECEDKNQFIYLYDKCSFYKYI